MEWKVANALSRDVEREHLNKILREIRSAIGTSSSSSGGGMSEQDIIALIRRYAGSGGGGAGGGGGSSVPTTITLEGNVTGTGSSTIVTTVDPSILGIRDAPVDSLFYWRTGGQWQPVPGNITSLSTVYGDGMMAYTDDEGWVLREIEGTANQIVVTDGDGVGNPTISLHTDILDELDAALNYDELKTTLVAGTNITLVPDDLAETITVNSSGGGGVLPVVTGEIAGGQPVFVYNPDGSLVYIGVE